MPKRLSEHFTLEEMIVSQEAARRGIDNAATEVIVANLTRVAAVLEEVRELLGGRAILISSGYRCPQLNEAVHGSKRSAHMRGLAADFIVPSFGSVLNVAQTIANSNILYDQLIFEYGTWVHIGLAAEGEHPRGQKLSIFKGTDYLNGIVERPS